MARKMLGNQMQKCVCHLHDYFALELENRGPLINLTVVQEKYAENNVLFRPGGAIFIELGGEGPINVGSLQGGLMYQIAKLNNGSLYQLEHRYYGGSQPTVDHSVPNLKYHTIEQALEDAAQFIIKIKQDNATLADSKVVVFGCSYSGSLALWMRQKYPHLVHAAVSGSAPINSKIEAHEYHDVIQRNLGPACASVVMKGVEEILRLFATGNAAKVQQDFNKCWPFTPGAPTDGFFDNIALKIAYKANQSPTVLANLCNSLQNPTSLTDYERLAAVTKDLPCTTNYKSSPLNMPSTARNRAGDDGRMWSYQRCTQLGGFGVSLTDTSLYGRTIFLEYFYKTCKFNFGITGDVTAAGVAAANARYGGLNPNVTRVISLHGSLDPWSGLGLSADLNPDAPVYVVNGTTHCTLMNTVTPNDSVDARNAKLAIIRYVGEWLQQP